ncbi:MAG: hypothetical protein Q8P45_03380 [Candidatus Harrisonbacteria bacterium]|nr:hypothetical protein [Candidatus Harrisonbacteria bacterium]
MSISNRQKRAIKELGGVRITGLHNGEEVLKRADLPYHILGTWVEITLDGVRSVSDECIPWPPKMQMLITLSGEMLLVDLDQPTGRRAMVHKLFKQLAPNGHGGRARWPELRLDLYEVLQRQKSWDWEPSVSLLEIRL